MLGDEHGLDELLLGHGLENLGDELALAPCIFGVSAILLQDGHQVLAAAVEGNLFAGVARCQAAHGLARPLAGQVDVDALVADLERAASSFGGCLDEALGEVHHAVQVGESLICLHGGELGVVIRVHAFVAELAADLEHLLETAYEQALERQLGGDAQEVVAVECVEVRDERLCVRAAQDGMQKRRFHLVEALVLHVAADGGDDLEALLEDLLDFGIHDQIDVTLAITRLLVRQAVELLGQRANGLAEQLEGRHGHGQLTATRAHHSALDADPVAHIKVLQAAEGLFAQLVDAAEQLHVARGVAQAQKGDLALNALGHDAAGDLDQVLGGVPVLKVRVQLLELGQVMAVVERMAIGVLACIEHGLALGLAHLDGIVFDNFRGIAHGKALLSTGIWLSKRERLRCVGFGRSKRA